MGIVMNIPLRTWHPRHIFFFSRPKATKSRVGFCAFHRIFLNIVSLEKSRVIEAWIARGMHARWTPKHFELNLTVFCILFCDEHHMVFLECDEHHNNTFSQLLVFVLDLTSQNLQ